MGSHVNLVFDNQPSNNQPSEVAAMAAGAGAAAVVSAYGMLTSTFKIHPFDQCQQAMQRRPAPRPGSRQASMMIRRRQLRRQFYL